MRNEARFVSEEDVRQHVVGAWLRDHGFMADQIRVEYSFEIHLGHSSWTIGDGPPTVARPRADVLVRTSDGRNLLVVEVKAPNVSLGEDERLQAVSYARALKTGIAPFAVVTNGSETHVYDAASGERVDGEKVPVDHSHVLAGYRIEPDPALVAEAVEALVGLSPENLVVFCRDQVRHRMRRLRSDDLHSGSKYIPQLYTARPAAEARLAECLSKDAPVTLLVGPPQVGKTNLMCHAAESRLKQGLPTLFYPAVRMAAGLVGEIAEDFGWLLRDAAAPIHLVLSKLTSILRRTNQSLVIFVDGLNEADAPLARALDKEAERLETLPIQIVTSFTTIAARRLLIDSTGNPAYLAEAAHVQSTNHTHPHFWRTSRSEDAVIEIGEFTQAESKEAYERYAGAYGVNVPQGHNATRDPFLLRTAMEGAEWGTLPSSLHGPQLIERGLYLKFRRMGGEATPEAAKAMLRTLADALFEGGEPLSLEEACRLWGAPVTEPVYRFEEAGLLMNTLRYTNQPISSPIPWGREGLDFYSTRERDFAIAYWARDWPNSLVRNDDATVAELRLALGSETGRQALSWFLLQDENLDRLLSLCEWLAPSNAYDVMKGLLRVATTGLEGYPSTRNINPLLLPFSDGEHSAMSEEDWGSLGRSWCIQFIHRVAIGVDAGKTALIDTYDLDLRLATLEFLRGAMPQPYASSIADNSDALVRLLSLPLEVDDAVLRSMGDHVANLLYPDYLWNSWLDEGNELHPLSRIRGVPASVIDIALNGPTPARLGACCVLGYLSQLDFVVALSDAETPVSPEFRAGVVAAIHSIEADESWPWDGGEQPEIEAWPRVAERYADVEDVCLPLAERFQVDATGLRGLVDHVTEWLRETAVEFLGELVEARYSGRHPDTHLVPRYVGLDMSFLVGDSPEIDLYLAVRYMSQGTGYLSEDQVVDSIIEVMRFEHLIPWEEAEDLARNIVRKVFLRRARQNPNQLSLWGAEKM